MKKLISILFVVSGLLFLFSFSRLGQVAAQSGPATYTTYTQVTFTGKNLNHPTGLAYTSGYFPCEYGRTSFLSIVDTGNHVIRGLDPISGNFCILAGNGKAGYVNSSPLASEFNNPTGITVIPLQGGYHAQIYIWDEVYVSDSSNYTVRVFCLGTPINDPNCPKIGHVATLAGTSTKGYVNGPLLSAMFAHQGGMHFDIGLSVDTENHSIRSVGTAVGTYAGIGSPGFVNGSLATAQFNYPTKLAMDSTRNVYVADVGNSVIRKIDTAGNVTTFVGSGVAGYADGTGTAAQFRLASGIVYNSNDNSLYVADSGNNVIRKITMAGTVTTYAGNRIGGFVNGSLLQSEFYHPTDIIMLGSNFAVSDTYNNAIRIINTTAGTVSTLVE